MPWAALSRNDWWELVGPDGATPINDVAVKHFDIAGGLDVGIYNTAQLDSFTKAAMEVIGGLVGVDERFADLVDRIGLSDLSGDPLIADANGDLVEDFQTSGGSAPSGRGTVMQDPVRRAAIERRSLDVALKYYDKIGGIDAVELGKPYDIKVTVNGIERHCEVKGSFYDHRHRHFDGQRSHSR